MKRHRPTHDPGESAKTRIRCSYTSNASSDGAGCNCEAASQHTMSAFPARLRETGENGTMACTESGSTGQSSTGRVQSTRRSTLERRMCAHSRRTGCDGHRPTECLSGIGQRAPVVRHRLHQPAPWSRRCRHVPRCPSKAANSSIAVNNFRHDREGYRCGGHLLSRTYTRVLRAFIARSSSE